jgi:hypothetical protein
MGVGPGLGREGPEQRAKVNKHGTQCKKNQVRAERLQILVMDKSTHRQLPHAVELQTSASRSP